MRNLLEYARELRTQIAELHEQNMDLRKALNNVDDIRAALKITNELLKRMLEKILDRTLDQPAQRT